MELDEQDLEVIRREKTRGHLYFNMNFVDNFPIEDKWSQPSDLYRTIIICSIAAAVQ